MATTTQRRILAPTERQKTILGIIALPIVAALAAPVLVMAIGVLGVFVIAVPLVLPAGWYIVRRPDHGALLLLAIMIVFEDDNEGLLSQTDLFYRFLPGLPFQPSELILGAIALGLVLDLSYRREPPKLHAWLVLPMPILAAALASGTVTGYLGEADIATMIVSFRALAFLVVVPLTVAASVDRFGLVDRMFKVWFVCVAGKCAYGTFAWFGGQGRGLGTTRLTYYTPTMNQFAMVLILGVIALAVRFNWRTVSTGEWVALGFATFSLIFALRRSFWIGLVLGLMLVILVASGRRGRVWVFLGGGLVVAGSFLMLSAGGATNSDNPVLQRAEIRNDAEDRYRLDEQTNVFNEIQRHPWTGIGLGVPWEARHPLSLEFDAGRNYAHVAPWFFWLKLGPFGLLGYFAISLAFAGLGVRLWRLEQPNDKRLAAAGLAIAIGELCRIVVELTGTFTGASGRFTMGQMFVLGWLGAAVLRSERRATDERRAMQADERAVVAPMPLEPRTPT